MKHLTKVRLFFILFLFYYFSFANNLQISNFTIVNVTATTANIQFNISWDNSWRDTSNWDAAWVFIKYRHVGSIDTWSHATLSTSGHIAPLGTSIFTPSDGKGVFVYRNAIGNGSVSFSGVELQWDFGQDGVLSIDNIDIKIFGIEMVHVPTGSFFVGDGQTLNNQIYANFEAGTTGNPFEITSEAALTLGGGSPSSLGNNNRHNQFVHGGSCGGCLSGSGDDFDDSASQTLPVDFPKGYEGFYCMKYEMTQQQFVDMLNCLTYTQQSTYLTQTGTFYFNGTLADNRYDITLNNGNYQTSDPYAPIIFFDWIKSAAYADWAALRPMTELEFEKACRGFETPITDEFAWGNANIDLSDNLTLTNESFANETINSGYNSDGVYGNAWMRAGNQSMTNVARVGVFAAHPINTGRISSGSSVWGIMELSGNAWERAVSIGHPEGRKFTGLHGDGNLSENGYANVTNWPGSLSNTTVESNIGVGYRGGGLAYPSPNLERNGRVSSRRIATSYYNTVINDDGVRFVRTSN